MDDEKDFAKEISEFEVDLTKGHMGPAKPSNSPSQSQIPKVNPPSNQSPSSSSSKKGKE